MGSLWALWALAGLDLSLGDAEAAARALAPLTQAIEEEGLSEPIRAFFLPDAIEALIALGRLDRAERLIVMLEECGRRLERPWALAPAGRCRGLLLAARGEHGAAVGVLERALCDHDRVSMPVERARTLLALGMVQRRKGRRRDAQGTLRQALEIFDDVGATLWARRTRRELRGTGGRPSSSQELTASEGRVARLAAGGMTNREVAVALFISPVEANLARVYRKLGIHSRAELGARLAPRAGPDQEVA